MQRCYNKKCRKYPNYGGRGIKVCERWLDPANFIADMSATYLSGLTLDRIDVDDDYSPENCRWASHTQQNRNRTDRRMVTFRGETRHLFEWAEMFGINRSTIACRFHKGWPIDKVMAPRISTS